MPNSESNSILWLTLLALSDQAMRDSLTGLHNRRYFEETLTDHLAAALRYNRPLACVLFDLDQFKQTNDELGHAAGDAQLRQFADHLRQTARRADIVCRYGGDEFAILLPETSLEAAQQFAERVLNSSLIPATAGIAALPLTNQEAPHGEELVAAADADLLAHKRTKHAR